MKTELVGSNFKKNRAHQKVKSDVSNGDGIVPEILE